MQEGRGGSRLAEGIVRAAIYCRISRDSERDGAGVARQEADCRALVERRGWDTFDVYVDNDVSASNGDPRPEYERLIDDVKNGQADAVVAWRSDRLHRSPRELEDFIDLIEANGVLVDTVMTGEVDLTTSSGRMHARIRGAVDREEAEKIAERTARAHEELADKGKDSGGPRPYGFETDRVTIREDEAAVVRDAARRVLAGDGLTTIVRDMNERGIPTATEYRRRKVVKLVGEGLPHEDTAHVLGLKGARAVQRELNRDPVEWHPRVLRRMLLAPRTAGLRVHHGEVKGEAEWDAILDEDTYERVRLVLTDPARRKTRPARKYLLTAGILRCGRCDGPMGSQPSKGRRGYRCRTGPGHDGCGRRNVVAGPVEGFVSEAVLSALESQELADLLADRDGADDSLTETLRELEDVEASIKRLHRDHHVEKIIGRADYLAVNGELEDRRRSLQRRAAEQGRLPVLGDVPVGERLREWWAESGLNRRRELIRAVVERVVVNDPVVVGLPEFDPRRIDIVWKG